jgi:hypothetical protein
VLDAGVVSWKTRYAHLSKVCCVKDVVVAIVLAWTSDEVEANNLESRIRTIDGGYLDETVASAGTPYGLSVQGQQ